MDALGADPFDLHSDSEEGLADGAALPAVARPPPAAVTPEAAASCARTLPQVWNTWMVQRHGDQLLDGGSMRRGGRGQQWIHSQQWTLPATMRTAFTWKISSPQGSDAVASSGKNPSNTISAHA